MKAIFSVSLLLAVLYSPVTAQPVGNGYIGLNLPFEADYQSAGTLHKMPLQLIGSSRDHALTTEITFLSDLVHLAACYNRDNSFLNEGNVYSCDYFFLSLNYSVFETDSLQLYAGYGSGYRVILSSDNSRKNTVPLQLNGGLRWFINDHFMLETELNARLPVISEGIKRFRSLRHELRLVFDPYGPVKNPLPDSIFLSIGGGLNYITYENETEKVNLASGFMTLSFTLLY